MWYKASALLVRFLSAAQSQQHAPLIRPLHGTCLLLQTHNPTEWILCSWQTVKKIKTSSLCLQSMLLLLLFHWMLHQFGIFISTCMVSRIPVMLYCSYSSSMSLRCRLVLFIMWNMLASYHDIAGWLHEKSLRGWRLLPADWSPFLSSHLLQHVPMHSRVHPLLHVRFQKERWKRSHAILNSSQAHRHIFSLLPAPFICRALTDGLLPVYNNGANGRENGFLSGGKGQVYQ